MSRPVSDLLVLGSGVAGLSAAVRARRAGLSVTVLTKGELGWSATALRAGRRRRGAGSGRRLARAARLRHAGRGRRALRHRRGAGPRQRGPAAVRELMALGAHFDQVDGRRRARPGPRGRSLRRPGRARGRRRHRRRDRARARRRGAGLGCRRAGAAGSRPTCSSEDGRVRRRPRRSDPTVAAGACGAVTWWSRPAAPGSASRSPPTPRCRPATASRWPCGPASRSPTSSSCSSTRPRCTTRRCRARCCPRRSAVRARSCATSTASRSCATSTPRRPRAARRGGQGDQPPPHRPRPRPPLARRHRDRRLPRAVPDHLASLPGRRPRPDRDWLPVAPAAHYLSGGVCTDLDGASTLPGLWACGEAACSGVHGANRLASNSLLEGLVFAARAVEAIVRRTRPVRADRGAPASARRRRTAARRRSRSHHGRRPVDPRGAAAGHDARRRRAPRAPTSLERAADALAALGRRPTSRVRTCSR